MLKVHEEVLVYKFHKILHTHSLGNFRTKATTCTINQTRNYLRIYSEVNQRNHPWP